ncbi:MAG: hypothetical protein DMG49_19900, partial [Acidobacteria bacterium]
MAGGRTGVRTPIDGGGNSAASSSIATSEIYTHPEGRRIHDHLDCHKSFVTCYRHWGGSPMQNRNSRVASTLLLVLAIIFSPSVLRADVTGSILGVVHDRTQAVVAGARIIATNVQTNFKQETTPAADGSYRILALPAGTYKLTATGAGFRQYNATDIEVKVNDQLHIDITLEVGSVQQEVNVVASTVQVETESTQLGDVIDSKKMLALP